MSDSKWVKRSVIYASVKVNRTQNYSVVIRCFNTQAGASKDAQRRKYGGKADVYYTTRPLRFTEIGGQEWM